jgi:hypothetical protein
MGSTRGSSTLRRSFVFHGSGEDGADAGSVSRVKGTGGDAGDGEGAGDGDGAGVVWATSFTSEGEDSPRAG